MEAFNLFEKEKTMGKPLPVVNGMASPHSPLTERKGKD